METPSSSPDKSVRTDYSDSDDSFELYTLRHRIISIEGNIGSGKSTLLGNLKKSLASTPGVVFLKEPVDDWATITDVDGVTMLEKFYANQKEYAFPFQMMAYISRLALFKNTIKENPGAIIITERSLNTDREVFAKMNSTLLLRFFKSFSKEWNSRKGQRIKNTIKKCFCFLNLT